MKWKVGKALKSDMGTLASVAAALGGVGAMAGAGISVAAQDIQAFGFFAAATGSRLGLTQLDWSKLSSAAMIGAGVAVAGAVAMVGADSLKSWRAKRSAQAALHRAGGPRP